MATETEIGRSPSGRATRPTDQAPAGLGDTASVPNAVADKLREARALIERGWTQCRYAIDAKGVSVDVNSRKAVAWCATGALYRSFEGADWREASDLLSEVAGGYITCWNDSHIRTQAEVLAAFDAAIDLARAA
jgi:hypothetical protein